MSLKLKQSYWRIVWRQFKKNKLAVAALVILVILACIALGAPFLAGEKPIIMMKDGQRYIFPNIINYKDLASLRFDSWEPAEGDYALRPLIPHAPQRSDLRSRFSPPAITQVFSKDEQGGGELAPRAKKHWLGTDDRGRDILSRMIWGTRISMTVGFVAVGISTFLGIIIGCLAGYYGGVVDMIIQRIIEIFICFPVFILILALIAFLPPSIYNIMIVLGITGWTRVARLVRGEFLKLRSSDYAIAAKATGLSDSRIMFRHLLPNALAPVLVSATFGVAGAILIESALSFLGFGVPPPTASWGEILLQSKNNLHRGAWWLVTFPGVAIFLTVTSFNLVGEGLRDAMDPRLRQ